jgi:hypothetical protein
MASKRIKIWIWERPDWPEFHWDQDRLAKSLTIARRRATAAADILRTPLPSKG